MGGLVERVLLREISVFNCKPFVLGFSSAICCCFVGVLCFWASVHGRGCTHVYTTLNQIITPYLHHPCCPMDPNAHSLLGPPVTPITPTIPTTCAEVVSPSTPPPCVPPLFLPPPSCQNIVNRHWSILPGSGESYCVRRADEVHPRP